MKNFSNSHGGSSHLTLTIALVVLTLVGAFIYFTEVPKHPPGFYIDESSIAYNAHLIAQTGADEHRERWPLYFRAFGDYKNPVYVYLLAGLFKLTGPSIAVARSFSAALGLASALLLGLLAWKISRQLSIVVVVALSAFFTPWFYESSRLVFEVALYPISTVLLLLALWRASRRQAWHRSDVVAIAATLALLTYSYSIGRLLAPLLAAGLALFIRRHGWRSIVKVWLAYLITLVPLLVFYRYHPGALSERFTLITYITPDSSWSDIVIEFFRHYLANVNPWRWLITGENNVRDHLGEFGSLLAATVVLAIAGAVLVLRNHRREPWWQFILYALLISVIPASLTRTEFPQLRLIAFPVFFLVLTIPAIVRLLNPAEAPGSTASSNSGTAGRQSVFRRSLSRGILAVAVVLLLVQGTHFQLRYHRAAPDLWYVYDARFPRKVLAVALASGRNPIYLVDPPGKSGYIQALWYGVLQGLDPARLVRLPNGASPPPSAIIISSAEDCANCRVLARSINYTVYTVPPFAAQVTSAELPANAFRAFLIAEHPPVTLNPGERTRLSVIVKNISEGTWPAVGQDDGRYDVRLRHRWRALDGTQLKSADDFSAGSVRLPYDLEPGDTAGVSMEIAAPLTSGEFVLEIDVVQEQVSWFSDRGSQPLRLPLKVIHQR